MLVRRPSVACVKVARKPNPHRVFRLDSSVVAMSPPGAPTSVWTDGQTITYGCEWMILPLITVAPMGRQFD